MTPVMPLHARRLTEVRRKLPPNVEVAVDDAIKAALRFQTDRTGGSQHDMHEAQLTLMEAVAHHIEMAAVQARGFTPFPEPKKEYPLVPYWQLGFRLNQGSFTNV